MYEMKLLTEKAEEAPSECEALLKECTKKTELVARESSYKDIVENLS
jgi:hypothetical protein